MYVTRDLDEAAAYVLARFNGEPAKRTGLLASSHAKIPPKHGVDNGFQATKQIAQAPIR